MPDNFRRIDPKQTAVKDLHQFIVGAIAPRPIAFASSNLQSGNPIIINIIIYIPQFLGG